MSFKKRNRYNKIACILTVYVLMVSYQKLNSKDNMQHGSKKRTKPQDIWSSGRTEQKRLSNVDLSNMDNTVGISRNLS